MILYLTWSGFRTLIFLMTKIEFSRVVLTFHWWVVISCSQICHPLFVIWSSSGCDLIGIYFTRIIFRYLYFSVVCNFFRFHVFYTCLITNVLRAIHFFRVHWDTSDQNFLRVALTNPFSLVSCFSYEGDRLDIQGVVWKVIQSDFVKTFRIQKSTMVEAVLWDRRKAL